MVVAVQAFLNTWYGGHTRVGGGTQEPNCVAFGALLKALEDYVPGSLEIIQASRGQEPVKRKAGDTAEWHGSSSLF